LVSAAKVERVVAAVVVNFDYPSILDVATRRWLHAAPDGVDFACPAVGWMA
jgi:hypothetical protein